VQSKGAGPPPPLLLHAAANKKQMEIKMQTLIMTLVVEWVRWVFERKV
jgi:hypothetical protein